MPSSDFPEMATEIADVLAAEYHRATAIDPRLRRLQRALADLGLQLPPEWAQHTRTGNGDDSVTFAPITWAAAQRLVAVLEDIASSQHSSSPTAGQGERANLFSPDPCPAPQLLRPERASTVHIKVPR